MSKNKKTKKPEIKKPEIKKPEIKVNVSKRSSDKASASSKQEETLMSTARNSADQPKQTNEPPANATLQQRRAHFALTRINDLATKLKVDDQKKFVSYAKEMPFMIHANGLGQTAAFYRRKGKDDVYFQLYSLLGDWLCQSDQPFAGHNDLLEAITQENMTTYLAAQAEAVLFLDWVKNFAGAFMASDGAKPATEESAS